MFCFYFNLFYFNFMSKPHPQNKTNYNVPIEKRYTLIKDIKQRAKECRHLQNKRKRCLKKICKHWCCYEPVIIEVKHHKTNRNRATIGTMLSELLINN